MGKEIYRLNNKNSRFLMGPSVLLIIRCTVSLAVDSTDAREAADTYLKFRKCSVLGGRLGHDSLSYIFIGRSRVLRVLL